MSFLVHLIAFPIAIALALFVVVLLRAVVARLVTGKWPHQSPESKDIFDNLP